MLSKITFGVTINSTSARAAFKKACNDPVGTYDGTIGEKSTFSLVILDPEIINDKKLFAEAVEHLLETRFTTKWGPAGCIRTAATEYYFFGWVRK